MKTKIYDSVTGADRYTLVHDGEVWGFGPDPFHPQGFGQYVGEVGDEAHNVSPEWLDEQKEIELFDLPEPAQLFVLERTTE